jgi:hypothetical protein
MNKGLWQHFRFSLLLNFRSVRPILYGYLVPVVFLVGFGSVFRAGDPPLLEQMGQILTITILGGACLGMPTSLVHERELGLWRRYRILPVRTSSLIGMTLLVRMLLVFVGVLLQIVLAKALYGTPLPTAPIQFLLAYTICIFAFLGLGLIVAGLAPDVPSVQALGQCIFLPMILIGGVGVPLIALPEWAQTFSAFLPGRYAVEVLQAAYVGLLSSEAMLFACLALFGIGMAAFIAGLNVQRWDPTSRIPTASLRWVALALAAWVAVGSAAHWNNRIAPVIPGSSIALEAITDSMIATISFEGLPEDNGFYTPMASLREIQYLSHRMREFTPRLESWNPGTHGPTVYRLRNLLCVAAVADISQDQAQRFIARLIFEHAKAQWNQQELEQALAFIILNPTQGSVITHAPELGLRGSAHPEIIRERVGWYARKFLGRLTGAIVDG